MISNLVGGYNDNIAIVDLDHNKVNYEKISYEDKINFIGGRGLGVKLLFKSKLTSDSLFFGIFVGPLIGTGIPLANRTTLVFHSPLTNTIAYANTGGYLGTALKKAGFDGIILLGESNKPIYIIAKDGTIAIEDASSLWGKNNSEVIKLLRAKHGDSRILSIGPAGEKLVKFANVVNDGSRSSGVRHGAGYVLGKMKVKAIIVPSGHARFINITNKEKYREVLVRLSSKIKKSPLLNMETGLFAVYGTPLAVLPLNQNGALPVKNYTLGRMNSAENLSGQKMSKTILIGRLTCTACSVQCRRETATFKAFNFRTEGPDYAQISSLGSNCFVDGLEAVAFMNYLCYELGLDPIETGNLLAVYAEATEKGLVKGSNGLNWGNVGRMVELIKLIAEKRDEGALFSEGINGLIGYLGDSLIDISVMGITMQNADPRAEPAWGLLNATENTGSSCHIWVYPDLIYSFKNIEGIRSILPKDPNDYVSLAKGVKFKQDLVCVLDSLQICAFSFMAFDVKDYVDSLNAITGLDISEIEFLKIGERIFNLERLYDLKFGSKHDYLPYKFIKVPNEEGKVCNIEELLKLYYIERGWISGKPSIEKIKELNLSSFFW
jgi:aldehyde:ferredoxin oxidoreductase